MNEVISTILSRKGTKEYKREPVEQDKLELILHCAAAAPNAFNAQKWHFAAVISAGLLEEMEKETLKALIKCGVCEEGEEYRPYYDAPAVLIFSASRENAFAKQDCSTACQNAAIAAKSLGLGSRFLDVPNNLFNSVEGVGFKERCKIPEGYDTVCFLSLGYPCDESEPPTMKRSDVYDIVQ